MTNLIIPPRRFTAKFLEVGLFALLTFYISLSIAKDNLSGLPLAQIEVEGNTKTQTRWVLKWAEISVGDAIDQSRLEHSKQNIFDTGLFQEVTLRTELRKSKPTLIIKLEEKIYTLLLPRFNRTGDGDLKLGINLKLYNINGTDQTLNLLAEKSELNNGDDGRRYRIGYDLPQYNLPYQYHIGFSDSVTNTLNSGFRNVEFESSASFSMTRNWHVASLSTPLSLTALVLYQNIQLQSPYPDALAELDAGKSSRLGFSIEHDAIHTEQYRRYGYFHSLEIQQGLGSLGSDYLSRIIKVESRFYLPLSQRDNFNTRLLFGWAKNSPFNVPYYELGGSDTLRGLEQGSISGDVLMLGNFEYVKGFESYPSFRWSSFIDIGSVYPNFAEIDLGELQTSIGFGGRWKLLSFVETDLFFDYAYNIDTDNSKIYAGTSLTF
ncbi:MAG: outer membrane protein assembly factor BamA [Urechidicola sp.]|jgi:outer membrane protein assembly factor BamA